ncbi:MAG: tetratricopeptide repeat protein, partial [Bacteroidota bacterium]
MSVEDHVKQGYQALQKEDYQQALKHFQQALARESTHPESLYGSARAYFKLQNYEASIQAFDRLINLLPNNATYLSERGVALHWTGNNQLALVDFDRAVELEPNNPYRYSSRAYIKDRLKDYQGAIDDYSKAIELDPEDAIAYNNRGLIEEKLGYMEKAKKSYQSADQLDQRQNGSKKPQGAQRFCAWITKRAFLRNPPPLLLHLKI